MSNDNTESISAKLRRWADESESADFVTCHPMTRALDECGLIDSLGGYVQERELFRRIADEIDREIDELRELVNPGGQPIGESIREIATGEDKYPWGDSKYPLLKRALDRYYLPRPLFEDGEPVHDSDLEEIGGLATCCVYTDGSWRFDPDKFEDEGSPKHWDKQQGRKGDRVKRPKQRVLDADGVPIEVGDTVYLVPGEHCDVYPLNGYGAGVEYRVNENNSPNHKPNGRICISGGDCIYGYPMPEQVTHREPDSLKKLLNDIRGYLAESPCIDVRVRPWERRLTALIELDGRDA